MRALRILVAAVFAVAFGHVSASVAAQAAGPAALSGGWKLNVEASINPNGPESATPSGSGRGGRSNSGGRSGGDVGGGDLGREELQRFNAHLAMFRHAPPLLGIQATATDVMLIYDPDPAKGLIYKYKTDNKKSKMVTPAGDLDVKVKWNGKVLHREVESKESLKVVEDYTVSDDGKQLVVTVVTTNIMVRMEKVEIKRVYDRTQ